MVGEDDGLGTVLGRELDVGDRLEALDDDGQLGQALKPRDVVPRQVGVLVAADRLGYTLRRDLDRAGGLCGRERTSGMGASVSVDGT